MNMTRLPLVALALLAAVVLPACKIVKTPVPGEGGAIAAGEAGDDARIAALLDETLEAKLLPLIREKAVDLADLRKALAGGLDAAGAAQGNRGAGEGAAWNFAVKGSGKVIAANLESRARKAELDTDGDGKADVTLQLGPVIKGSSLRDAVALFNFGDFRDQIEFAKLGRVINDRVSAGLTLPEGDLIGRTLNFTGAVTLTKATDPLLVTAIEVTP
jgi:predicted lipoprotein